MTYHFTVPGKPATGSFRFTKTGHRYTPANVAEWKALVRLVALDNCPTPLFGPIAIQITVRVVRPDSWPKRPTKGNPWPWTPWRRPDVDNCAYGVKNALKGVAYVDDAQIVDEHLCKVFGEREEVEVHITEALPEMPSNWADELAEELLDTVPAGE
jgi:Holliday junction resolvase RusA-like endonuclease